jgi:hypothetical protein
MNTESRLLSIDEVQPAARAIAQAFLDDPLCAYMLPIRRTRAGALYKFFRAYGELNIQNQRGYGVGEPLLGVAYWHFPDQGEMSVHIQSLTIFLPLLFWCSLYSQLIIR